ncbi:methyltransferase family protein [Aureimonas populi]|uniref:Methyltransferase family protein n=1 Tax=Aureimonas populi TaxID=1701758 RepID=A0ABW5CIS9_9HYPH|nr:isoprenylcysteine carboxylmethyltransferase family protein [Aureimonas populi]
MLPLLLVTEAAAEPGSWQRDWIEATGVLFIVLAILGRSWCTLYIGGRKVERLVRAGPYSVTRNPLYLISLAAAAGVGMQTGSLVLTLIVVLVAYAIFTPVIRREEEVLRHVHGADFEEHCRTVPRLLPRFGLWNEEREITINPFLWRRTVLDSMWFLLLVPLVRSLGTVRAWVPDLPAITLP